jgi:hypothetical protein
MEANISFTSSGHLHQRVNITKEGLTPEALVKGLNEGIYSTTVQEYYDGSGAPSQIIDSFTLEKIAEIEEVDNYLEHTDFELREV